MSQQQRNGRSLMPALPSQSPQAKTSRRQSAAAGSQQRIDQQIWLLHQAMAIKLLQQPALADSDPAETRQLATTRPNPAWCFFILELFTRFVG